jgi:hypothetical protein
MRWHGFRLLFLPAGVRAGVVPASLHSVATLATEESADRRVSGGALE